MHRSTFDYLQPTDEQAETMSDVRQSFARCARDVSEVLPSGPDADHVMRLLRDAAMWANVAITRNSDGSPRQ